MLSDSTDVLKQLQLSAAALVAGWVVVNVFKLVCRNSKVTAKSARDKLRGKPPRQLQCNAEAESDAAASSGSCMTTGSSCSSSATACSGKGSVKGRSSSDMPARIPCTTASTPSPVTAAAAAQSYCSSHNAIPAGQSSHELSPGFDTEAQPEFAIMDASVTAATPVAATAAATAPGTAQPFCSSFSTKPERWSSRELLAVLVKQVQPESATVDASATATAAAAAISSAAHASTSHSAIMMLAGQTTHELLPALDAEVQPGCVDVSATAAAAPAAAAGTAQLWCNFHNVMPAQQSSDEVLPALEREVPFDFVGMSATAAAAAAAAVTTAQHGSTSCRPVLAGQSSPELLDVFNTDVEPDFTRASITAAAVAAAATGQLDCRNLSTVSESQSSHELLAALGTEVQPTFVDASQIYSVLAAADGNLSSAAGTSGAGSGSLLAVAQQVGTAALEPPEEGEDRNLADAVVRIQRSSTDSRSASKTAESSSAVEPEDSNLLNKLPVAVDELAHQLRTETDKPALLRAAKELQELAVDNLSYKLLIGQTQSVVQGLADLMYNVDTELQQAAMELIHCLACDVPGNQAELGCCNRIVSGLLQLLERHATAARAATVLWVLAADHDARGFIGSIGGMNMVGILINMLVYPAYGSSAAGLIWTLVSSNKDNQALFSRPYNPGTLVGGANVIKQLLMLMELGSREEQECAAGALRAFIFEHEEAVRVAQKLGVEERVLVYLREVDASAAAHDSMRGVLDILSSGGS